MSYGITDEMTDNLQDPYDSITFGNSLLLRVDGAVGAMSLSPNGRDAVLAGRRGLFIIDLDDPFTTPRWLHHITSWEVADVQWSPHHGVKPSWCISTSNQKALLWDLARPSDNAISNVLHEHTRAITDINFNPWDPEILATCSIDSFILSWDMRTPRKPVARWAEWRAGATQVKWNHKNQYEIASSHDNSFYIWDSRKGALPVLKVNKAHEGKINGLDFSNGLSNIITCSNDKKVKCWNLESNGPGDFSKDFNYFANENNKTNSVRPTVVMNADYPVARARNLPFGRTKTCGIMPLIGGQDAIHIIDYESAHQMAIETGKTQEINADDIYTFKGHNGAMKDFLWRTRHESYEFFDSKHKWKDYQLVTWSSKDFDLKLWPHDEDLYKKVNYNPSYQKILGAFSNEELDPEESPKAQSPGKGYFDEKKKSFYKYESYCMEPPTTIANLKRDNQGDMLSSLALYQIAQNHKQSGDSSQLNHLDWISGVRIGRTGRANGKDQNINTTIDEDGPSNLGEEVTIVGHKFPKVRFEKISVSTGELVISLKGPAPYVENIKTDKSSTSNSDKTEEPSNNEIDNAADKTTTKDPAKSSVSESVTLEDSIATTKGMTNNNDNDNSNDANVSTAANVNTSNNTTKNINNNALDSNSAANIINANTSSISNNLASNVEENDVENMSNNIANSTTIQTNDEVSPEQKLIFIRIEIIFPKSYPYLEETENIEGIPSKKLAKLQKANLIKFKIEETHELTLDLRNVMLKSLNEISHFYTNKYQKFCLEPCLRYLMGDKVELLDSLMIASNQDNENIVDPDGLIQEIGTEGWADDLINQQPDIEFNSMKDDSSSEEYKYDFSDLIPVADDDDDDDDELIRSTDSIRRDEYTNDDPSISDGRNIFDDISKKDSKIPSKKFFDSTPVPKGCGATWSHTGQLVCFFIPKNNEEEENKALQKFNIFKFTDGGFSLNTHSPHHQHNEHQPKDLFDGSITSHSESENESDDYDSQSDKSSRSINKRNASITSSSSEDSFSNDWDDILQDDVPSRAGIPGLLKTSVGLGNRYISHGNNRGSLNKLTSHGTSNYKSSVPGETENQSQRRKRNKPNKKNKNIVGIFDFKHLIPDKYELACEYRVLGDSPEKLAKYNGEVAMKYGLREISDAWRILEMILVKDVEIDRIRPAYDAFQDPVRVNSRNWKDDRNFNYLFHESDISKKMFNNEHRFYWGTHPFGRTWLIKEIMKYFEIKGNIQMLAMLSCILFENANNVKYPDLYNIPIHTPYHALPPPPATSAMRKSNDQSQIDLYLYPHNQKDSSIFESLATDSRNDLKSTDFENFHRNSSVLLFKRDNQLVNVHSYNKSISSSLDVRDHISERAGSFKKTIPFNSSYLPTELSLSHGLSKDSYLVTSPKQRHTKNTPSHQIQKREKNIPFSQKRSNQRQGRNIVRSSPFVTIEMQNVESLDLYDDVYSLLLLDTQQEEKIKTYREQYADMLYIWGLPINRIKILKFNYPGLDKTYSSGSLFDVHKCKYGLRKIKSKQNAKTLKSTNPIETIGTNAWNTSKKDTLKYCNLCNTVITKRLVVCINCEHALHSHCAVEWWANGTNDNDFNVECPSGCGCNCLDHKI